MADRTNPADSLERLAWTLNFHTGKSSSINQLANETGLSWATTQKYTELLEILGQIAPKIELTDEGVEVKDIGRNLESIKHDKDLQVLIYLLVQAEIKGGPTSELKFDEHFDVLHQYEETIQELDELNCLERDGNTIKLKPEGISLAGPARSELRNEDVAPSYSEGISGPVKSKMVDSFEGEILRVIQPGDYGRSTTTSKGTKDDYRQQQYGHAGTQGYRA